jgi:hypothetical protein
VNHQTNLLGIVCGHVGAAAGQEVGPVLRRLVCQCHDGPARDVNMNANSIEDLKLLRGDDGPDDL